MSISENGRAAVESVPCCKFQEPIALGFSGFGTSTVGFRHLVCQKSSAPRCNRAIVGCLVGAHRELSRRQRAEGEFLPHATAIATIVRITGGNFRLVDRVTTQIQRVQTVYRLTGLTPNCQMYLGGNYLARFPDADQLGVWSAGLASSWRAVGDSGKRHLPDVPGFHQSAILPRFYLLYVQGGAPRIGLMSMLSEVTARLRS
jgi:hypothetical protein